MSDTMESLRSDSKWGRQIFGLDGGGRGRAVIIGGFESSIQSSKQKNFEISTAAMQNPSVK